MASNRVAPQSLPIAVRGFTERKMKPRPIQSAEGWPRLVLVLDTETTTDATQALLFGSYRVCRWSRSGRGLVCIEEGIFYADDLPRREPEGFEKLKAYVESRESDAKRKESRRIRLLSRSEFVEQVLWKIGYRARGLIVGFNLPFDLSRIAIWAGGARGRDRAAFSLQLWEWKGKENQYRPRVIVQHVSSAYAFMRFARPARISRDDQRPSPGAEPDPKYFYAGRFLDLRTLAFALADRKHSLASAGRAFGVPIQKSEPTGHGRITTEYIDYNRQDVAASVSLLEALRTEFDRHPIDLDPCKAYSPASVAKAYLRAMGLKPPMQQFEKIPPDLHGFAMSAFYGGRAEARIRRTPVPVVHTDFTSMYPTVQALMNLWAYLAAESLEVIDITEEVESLLARVTVEGCFDPDFWRGLVGFAEVVPDGDILPCRAQYQGTEWNVGVNRLSSDAPLWYALPDLAASVLLSGRQPKVLRAFRLSPQGLQEALTTVELRGLVPIDPRTSNPFQRMIEERHRVRNRTDLAPEERDRTQAFLKTCANAGSYGVFVEMNRRDLGAKKSVDTVVYGRSAPFSDRTSTPEDPGTLCFPPIGAVITAAARLMLALLERCVTDLGGTYAFADTDSMAIVATRKGRLIACEGGPCQLRNGSAAIRALSWDQVDSIVERFAALNPYDPERIPGSILRKEDVNFDSKTKRQRTIEAFVISAKRYALFTRNREGIPRIEKHSEHGLGLYLNPIDPDSEDRNWIRQVWESLVFESLGFEVEEPNWLDRPAAMRTSVSNPSLLNRFTNWNKGKKFRRKIKPFSFMTSLSVEPLNHPPGIPQSRPFQLIGPYSSEPHTWSKRKWIDVHSGREFSIKAYGRSTPQAVRVKTHRDAIENFRWHPEAKSEQMDGQACGSQTVGLLARRKIAAQTIRTIGKETNLLEQQEDGTVIADPQLVYSDSSEWEVIRLRMKRISVPELSRLTGVPCRRLHKYRSGHQAPRQQAQQQISAATMKIMRRR